MKCVQKGLKKCDYTIYMDMNITTLPKKGLKRRHYSPDMNKDIVTLLKKGLKTKPYNIGMEKMDLKTRSYSIDMEKKDLKKLAKGQLIKLLLKKVSNHEDLLGNDPFKDEVAQEPANQLHHRELENGKAFHARVLMKTSYYTTRWVQAHSKTKD